MFTQFEISYIDIIILIGYLLLSRFIPLWLTRGKTEDTNGFFLGGRNFTWPLIGFSLFATNMSGASFVGLAGAGYSQGISVYSYEWMAAIILILFVFFIFPFYLRSEIDSRPLGSADSALFFPLGIPSVSPLLRYPAHSKKPVILLHRLPMKN